MNDLKLDKSSLNELVISQVMELEEESCYVGKLISKTKAGNRPKKQLLTL